MKKRVSSKYNISVPLKTGRRLVYNSLSGASAVLGVNETIALKEVERGTSQDELSAQVLAELEYGGFIVADDVDELKSLERAYNAHRFDPRQATLTIAPTMACNFGCDYCFQGQDKPNETMSSEVQDAIVNMIAHANPVLRNVGVAWYGGEPLLRKHVIESLSDRLISACKSKGFSYSASIVTNGYLLDVETAGTLASRGVTTAQITIDGTPEIHDTRRHLLGGQGSFERIVSNLCDVVDVVPMTYSIRINIDDRNAKNIRELLDRMAGLGLGHRTNLKVYFAPIEAITEGCYVVEDVALGKSRYGELEAELYRYVYDAGLTALPYPPRFHGTCAAVRPGGIVILPNGDLHKCWDTVSQPDRKVGTIFRLAELAENELVGKWLRWTPFDNHTCRNCKLLPNCAGACAYKFIHADATRGEAAVLPCPSWKYNINERLLQRAEAVGEIARDEWDPVEVRTDPRELCSDDVVGGGIPLPPEMQRHYEGQRLRLPVLR